MHVHRRLTVVAGVAVATAVAGCGGGSSGGAGSTSPSATPRSGVSLTGTAGTIEKNWEAFFSGKTSADQKIALVQDGQRFAATIRGQAKSSIATSAGATVSAVTVDGSTAAVTYTVTLGGQPALSNQKGQAVLESGTWKVSATSFCALLSLENSGTPPAPCPSTSTPASP